MINWNWIGFEAVKINRAVRDEYINEAVKHIRESNDPEARYETSTGDMLIKAERSGDDVIVEEYTLVKSGLDTVSSEYKKGYDDGYKAGLFGYMT